MAWGGGVWGVNPWGAPVSSGKSVSYNLADSVDFTTASVPRIVKAAPEQIALIDGSTYQGVQSLGAVLPVALQANRQIQSFRGWSEVVGKTDVLQLFSVPSFQDQYTTTSSFSCIADLSLDSLSDLTSLSSVAFDYRELGRGLQGQLNTQGSIDLTEVIGFANQISTKAKLDRILDTGRAVSDIVVIDPELNRSLSNLLVDQYDVLDTYRQNFKSYKRGNVNLVDGSVYNDSVSFADRVPSDLAFDRDTDQSRLFETDVLLDGYVDLGSLFSLTDPQALSTLIDVTGNWKRDWVNGLTFDEGLQDYVDLLRGDVSGFDDVIHSSIFDLQDDHLSVSDRYYNSIMSPFVDTYDQTNRWTRQIGAKRTDQLVTLAGLDKTIFSLLKDSLPLLAEPYKVTTDYLDNTLTSSGYLQRVVDMPFSENYSQSGVKDIDLQIFRDLFGEYPFDQEIKYNITAFQDDVGKFNDVHVLGTISDYEDDLPSSSSYTRQINYGRLLDVDVDLLDGSAFSGVQMVDDELANMGSFDRWANWGRSYADLFDLAGKRHHEAQKPFSDTDGIIGEFVRETDIARDVLDDALIDSSMFTIPGKPMADTSPFADAITRFPTKPLHPWIALNDGSVYDATSFLMDASPYTDEVKRTSESFLSSDLELYSAGDRNVNYGRLYRDTTRWVDLLGLDRGIKYYGVNFQALSGKALINVLSGNVGLEALSGKALINVLEDENEIIDGA